MPRPRMYAHAWRRLGSEASGISAASKGICRPPRSSHGRSSTWLPHARHVRVAMPPLQDYAEAGVHRLFIAPIRIEPFLAWCAELGKDPADARAGYSASLARRQDPSLIALAAGPECAVLVRIGQEVQAVLWICTLVTSRARRIRR